MAQFDTTLRDSQSSAADPIVPEKFDLGAYAAYEEELLEGNRRFAGAEEGLLVYRRFRADGVFYDKCRDRRESLARQLGALKASMVYKADIANFLEPWYGIGYIAASFGGDYIWLPGQAPSVKPLFSSAREILEADFRPIEDTPIGREILDTTEYFLEATKGKLPVSYTDIQSPLNMLSYLLPMNSLFLEIAENPEDIARAADLVTGLLIDFLKKEAGLIGECLVKPGHGFASSRVFRGAGESDDVSIMLSPDDYLELFAGCDARIGEAFGGTVYHSCGNWSGKIDMVKALPGLAAVDGAFSPETDPAPNDPAVFGEAFAGSGAVVNARAVGSAEDAFAAFSELWKPGQKLIAVTYCRTPEEQAVLYDRLHALAGC